MTSLLDARSVAIEGRLRPTDLRIAEPSLIALVGPNGGGKTSLLRALAGVEDASGSVAVAGQQLASAPPARRAHLVSFLPASREIVWPIAARDIIALGVAETDQERIDQLIGRLELGKLVHRRIDSLSTGERSRVLFARALAARPRLLLLDEPLSNLDPYWVLRTLELVREAVEIDGCAAILSLHDLSQLNSFDRLLLVNDGAIVTDGDPSAVIQSSELSLAFRVIRETSGWTIRRTEDRRSLP